MCVCCKKREAVWKDHCSPCVNEVYRIPLWVALRWLLVLTFRGFEHSQRYIRPQDRKCRAT